MFQKKVGFQPRASCCGEQPALASPSPLPSKLERGLSEQNKGLCVRQAWLYHVPNFTWKRSKTEALGALQCRLWVVHSEWCALESPISALHSLGVTRAGCLFHVLGRRLHLWTSALGADPAAKHIIGENGVLRVLGPGAWAHPLPSVALKSQKRNFRQRGRKEGFGGESSSKVEAPVRTV